MDNIKKALPDVEDVVEKSKEVSKGKSIAVAGIEPGWLEIYASVARRTRDNKEFSLSRYPYEAGPKVNAFSGGFFEHKMWPIRVDLERQTSMRPIAIYEANYINSTGYWLAFHEAAAEMRHEEANSENPDMEKVHKLDCWMQLSVRYALRVLGLRTEFYKMAAEDPATAKMLLSGLEKQSDVSAADNLEDTMEKLDGHMTTQLMKAVAALKVTNSGKKNGAGRGGNADGN